MSSTSTPQKSSKSSEKSYGNGINEQDFLSFSSLPLESNQSKKAEEGVKKLFDIFDYDLFTFQYKNTNSANGSTHNSCMLFKKDDWKEAARVSQNYNKKGYDVYFMVNEGDGIVHENLKLPRSSESVIDLSKLYIDTDNCEREKVDTYLSTIGLIPRMIVQSSTGRYHYYFFIDPVEKTSKNIQKWKAVQNMLARLGDETIASPAKSLGMDSTMHDYAKLLRVPGFFHISKQTLVEVNQVNDIETYSLEEIFDITDTQRFIDYERDTYGSSTRSLLPDFDSKLIIEPGDRYGTLQSVSLYLANQPLNNAQKTKFFTDFIIERLNNDDRVYLNDVGLTPKSRSLLESAFKKVERENSLKEAEMFEKLDQSEHPQNQEDISSWLLPDSFYLNAPNGFGDVVKQVMDNSLYPCAALSFGAALTALSILKAKTTLTPKGSSPAVYTLNVAISGYGKSAPMTIVQNTLVSLGLGSLIGNKIRSDRGLYAHLAANGGCGLFILDEIAPFLKAIQAKGANAHQAYINEALLSLYSSGSLKNVSFGKLANSNSKKGEPEIVIDNPMIAILGYTVPHSFNTLFNEESVATGLFQRFIPIVADIRLVDANEEANPDAVIKSDLFTYTAPFEASVEDISDTLDDDGSSAPTAPDDISAPPLMNIERRRAVYTPAAARHMKDLAKTYRERLITAAKNIDTSHLSGLYSRIAEQIERVATTLSIEEIDISTVEYAQKFIESRHKATLAIAESSVLKGEGSKSLAMEDILLSTVSRLSQRCEDGVVTKRDLYQSVRRHFKSSYDFETCLSDLVKFERLETLKNYKRNPKALRSSVGFRLKEVWD